METDIGPTLREARIRRKIDLTEIEERTKIRVRYLRALENEEWDLLPGPTYTRSFIRTYASFLGLDGERLADDYRRQEEAQLEPGAAREPVGVSPRLAAGGGSRFGAGTVAGIVAVVLLLALIVLGLTSGDGDDDPTPDNPAGAVAPKPDKQGNPGAPGNERVSIRLGATAEVWVCAVGAGGAQVIDGQILTPGAEQGPFRSRRFDLAFGNGGIELRVNGRPFDVEQTPSPVGYRVTTKGVTVLPEGSRPDCT